jgi:hypothetical protein
VQPPKRAFATQPRIHQPIGDRRPPPVKPTVILHAAPPPPAAGEEEEEKADVGPPPPLPLRKRFFHILGIDIIIDADLNPQVLELNDRPSLCVTVDFERELKESLIASAFEHVCPNGDVKCEVGGSGWELIWPGQAQDDPWKDVVHRILNPREPVVEKQPPTPQILTQRYWLARPKKEKKKKKLKKSLTAESAECS